MSTPDRDERPWDMPRPSEVIEAIERWRGLNLRGASQDAIVQGMLALRDIVRFHLVQRQTSTTKDLWRVRRAEESQIFDHVDDLWEPPADRVSLGRCNYEHQPVLYCSLAAATALDECGVRQGDEVLLIRYRGTELALDRVVGKLDPRPSGSRLLSAEGLLAYQILREFLRVEFTKPVGQGTEFLYRISAAVCEVWTDAEDGWLYPSVHSPTAENVALLPSTAHRKLRIEDVLRSRVENTTESVLRAGGRALRLPGIRVRHMCRGRISDASLVWETVTDNSANLFSRR